jgi:hypothetical protein
MCKGYCVEIVHLSNPRATNRLRRLLAEGSSESTIALARSGY